MRKHDVIVAKNYLAESEIDTLNRLVVIFLEQAELRTQQRQDLTLDYWRQNIDRLLEFSEQPVLHGPGGVNHDGMKAIAHQHYETFDSKRRQSEALDTDAEDLKAIEELEKDLKQKEGRK